jgi:N-acyl-D-aspartate/D-glutamate deacylase
LSHKVVKPTDDAIHEVAIIGGRIIDPESEFDGVANLVIDGNTVVAVTKEPVAARIEIDASGRVVAPGFIDLLSASLNSYGVWYKVADGVTTTLLMHGVPGRAATFFSHWEQAGSPVNYGGAFEYTFARRHLGLNRYEAASPSQRDRLVAMADEALREGFIGIAVSLEYEPGTSFEEVLRICRLAARRAVPVFFHARYSTPEPPGTNAEALQEIIEVAGASGASVHVEHIISTGGTFSMSESLSSLAKAREVGIDVTACLYPYNFWATYLGSARFDPGWERRFRITYSDLEIPGTGERLTEETFESYRRANKLAVAYAIPEADVRAALQAPFTMIGSDSFLSPSHNNHPRASGTFARVLGKYVREEAVIGLMEALAKMTILPANRLQAVAPALRKKGRLQEGSDADLVVFDPETVRDRATVADPAQYSEGIDWVLVAGQVVKSPDGVRKDVRSGSPIRYDPFFP